MLGSGGTATRVLTFARAGLGFALAGALRAAFGRRGAFAFGRVLAFRAALAARGAAVLFFALGLFALTFFKALAFRFAFAISYLSSRLALAQLACFSTITFGFAGRVAFVTSISLDPAFSTLSMSCVKSSTGVMGKSAFGVL